MILVTVSGLGSPPLIAVLTLLAAIGVAVRHRWAWALTLLCIVLGGAVLNVLLQFAVRHALPALADNPVLSITRYNFPDGHVAGAMMLYGSLAVGAVATIRAWRWRVAVVILAMIMLLGISFSRIALGASYLSDALAALAEGVAWLALCLTAVSTYVRRRRTLDSVKIRPSRSPLAHCSGADAVE